jgi:hypothetical protein
MSLISPKIYYCANSHVWEHICPLFSDLRAKTLLDGTLEEKTSTEKGVCQASTGGQWIQAPKWSSSDTFGEDGAVMMYMKDRGNCARNHGI